MPETATQKKRRLEKARNKYHQKRLRETAEDKIERLAKRKKTAENETETQRIARLTKKKDFQARARAAETPDEEASRLALDAVRHALARVTQTPDEEASRLALDAERHALARAVENDDERLNRLATNASRNAESRANETQQEHNKCLRRSRLLYANRLSDGDEFIRAINTFCDRICEICLKQCYPNQVVNYRNVVAKSYLPEELANKDVLIVCHRCNTHLKNGQKKKCPSKAYWNNLDPGIIPDVISALTEPERRLLARIIPFVKVIKFNGRFGQYGFQGNATLFALDIFEVAEKLPEMLPRSSDDAGIVVVTETLENLNRTRDFTISRDRVYQALTWLQTNNPLYSDVKTDHFARLDPEDIIRVVEPIEQQEQHVQSQDIEDDVIQVERRSAYIPLDKNRNISRILTADWHQGNSNIFRSGYAGVQCFAMAIANIVRAEILSPLQWDKNVLNKNMFEGDNIYATIRFLTYFMREKGKDVVLIPDSGYLELRNLDVIKHDFLMYDNAFSLNYDHDWLCQGNLIDRKNDGVVGKTLLNAMRDLFSDRNTGILVGCSKSLGLMHLDDKLYFTDSHSCGPKGAPLKNDNGKACIVECDTIEELHRICRRVLRPVDQQFSIHYINVKIVGNVMQNDKYLRNHATREFAFTQQEQEEVQQHASIRYQPDIDGEVMSEHIHIQTSVMAPIDVAPPDVEDVFVESNNINEIVRKTANNIVNVNHEMKAEEFSWYFLFPYGVNGLKEDREVQISPLDYFQFRILGRDTRFQRNDYLFYALSMFEFHRVQSTISACVQKVRGEEGAVKDLHLYMRNLRGSAAYWRTAHNELIAQIRCLGPPTWFMTLSCNDLNWPDMRRALLIADGRPDVDPSSISIDEAQRLIEFYPVIVSRHFMQRFNAFMKYLKNNHDVLGGRIKDFWWRVEFQNRGSPHIHMVLWIENAPSFDTDEGLKLIDDVVSCHLPSENEDSELHNIVNRNQMHQHRSTCYKNNNISCRFGFPRSASERTRVISTNSNEFIRNCGRICILKRRAEDNMVNNYCSTILTLWDGNMDIQPCGSNESIAHYIAKYIAKSEPTNLNESVAQAIRNIRREESNVSRQLFKACMRIIKDRQLSACECVYRLGHLPFHQSSRKCVFLNTRKPEQRYYTIRYEGNEPVGTNSNIFQRYEKRPRSHPTYDFANMCLLEFAMLFEPYYKKSAADNEESIDAEMEDQSERRRLISLTDNSKMVIRNVPTVVRVPFFMMHTDQENYFYSRLLQYVPYFNESELLEEFDSAREAFIAREAQLKETSRYMESFIERDQQLEDAFIQAHAFQLLDPEENIEAEFEEEIPDQNMTEEQFQAARNGMNPKQMELYNFVTNSIEEQLNGSENRVRLFVTGGAGTGKTYTFNTLKNQVNRCYGRTAAKVGALTGVAARLVGGTTLHNLLKLPVQKDGFITPNMPLLTGNYLKIMRQQWKDIEFIFIDEISMVPYEMLCMIDSRLRQLKKKENIPFGGINVILFGDLMQLPPVKGAQVFEQPGIFLPAPHLWRMFSLVELTQNMRQQGDTTFADLLNALRIGEMSAQHFELLMSKMLTEPTGDFALNKAIRIFPTRKQVDAHNNAVLDYYRGQPGTQISKIRAQDRLVDTRNPETIDMNKIMPADINKTGGMPQELEIFVGARIMLRSNIDLEKGLVNGSMGDIIEVVWPHFRRGQMYQTDIPSVRVDFGRDGIHLIEPRAVQFPAKFNSGTVERRMLPMILCYACTVHKMQGCTVDHAVVYLGESLFQDGQAYVALSRVRSLEGLRITELDSSKLTGRKPCNEKAIREMERMRNYQPPNNP